jgi:hypothetical protein
MVFCYGCSYLWGFTNKLPQQGRHMLYLEVASSVNAFYFIAPTTHTQSINELKGFFICNKSASLFNSSPQFLRKKSQ